MHTSGGYSTHCLPRRGQLHTFYTICRQYVRATVIVIWSENHTPGQPSFPLIGQQSNRRRPIQKRYTTWTLAFNLMPSECE